jgi:hypothetical protein
MDAIRLDHLLNHYVDEALSVAEKHELERLLLDSSDARDAFWGQAIVHGLIRDTYDARSGEQFANSTNSSSSPTEVGRRTDPHIEVDDAPTPAANHPTLPSLGPFDSSVHGAFGHFSTGWPVAYLIATVIFGIGLAIAALVHVSQPSQVVKPSAPLSSPLSPRSPAVARITDMVDCVWEETADREQSSGAAHQKSQIINHKSNIHLGDRLALRSGLIEIAYDTGAKIILQGPVTYEVESAAGGYLSLGKLTAYLERKSEARGQKSESENQNFVVRTPTAVVTDLGTEFGVEVDKSGTTQSHVFRGVVRVQMLDDGGKPEGVGQVLRENESVRVDGKGSDRRISVSVAKSVRRVEFIRVMPKLTTTILDLADVVAGGNGFSGKRGRGIDPTNGQIVDALPRTSKENVLMSGDGTYHRVAGIPFVDGVFIPDGARDEVQIDSAGNAFDGFCGTSATTWQHIWAGGALHGQDYPTKLGDIDYALPPHRLILLHASTGITFDLEAIRRAHPGARILRFRAAVANTETAELNDRADIWVLVDGKPRFQRREINGRSGVLWVSVPIGIKERFLTLATTDGGDGISHDWIIFGDPRLELRTVEMSEQNDAARFRRAVRQR